MIFYDMWPLCGHGVIREVLKFKSGGVEFSKDAAVRISNFATCFAAAAADAAGDLEQHIGGGISRGGGISERPASARGEETQD